MPTTQITRAQAEKFLAALKRQQKSAIDAGYAEPQLLEDFDGRPFTIMWEEGPYDWAYLFPHGGIEEEFGFKVADVSERLPAGLFAEAINHYSIAIYPA